MALSTDIERLGYGSPGGCVATGLHRQVISGGVATRTLLPEESGALCLFDRAAGVTYTLPTPKEGMVFDFGVTVDGTGTYKIATSAATVFITGGLFMVSLTVAEAGDTFLADGTSIVAVTCDGDTKGRLKGAANLRFTGLSSTLWHCDGYLTGAGTLATPFA
jgi:hypothetical protein